MSDEERVMPYPSLGSHSGQRELFRLVFRRFCLHSTVGLSGDQSGPESLSRESLVDWTRGVDPI